MILSKPLYSFLGFYFGQLYSNPIRTRAVSSCVIATAGSLVAQYISGAKSLRHDTLLAFSLYGLLFGGTVPYFFYNWLENAINEEAAFAVFKKLLVERLIYSPLYTAFTLYMIGRLEGRTHDAVVRQVEITYWPILLSSWKYLTVIQFLNLRLVPPMLRVLIVNLIGFFWTIYIAHKRRKAEESRRNAD